MKNLKYHIDKIGIVGVVFSSLCCWGFPAVISLFSALGISFLIGDALFLPLVSIFLAISITGTFLSYLKHRNIYPLAISIISSIVMATFLFVIHIRILAYAGVSGLIISSVYNGFFIKKSTAK